MIYTIIVIEKLIMKMSQYENNEQQSEDIVARNSNQENNATSIKLPKANNNVVYLNPDQNNFEKALIRARKAT